MIKVMRYITLALAVGLLAQTGLARKSVDTDAIKALPGGLSIIPGKSVGPFGLWTSIDDVIKILGKPGNIATHRLNYGNTYYMFNKYWFPKYGLTFFSPQDDPRQKIDAIDIWGGPWMVVGGKEGGVWPAFSTAFKDALDLIDESVDFRYRSICNQLGCAAYDSTGLWMRANGRDTSVDEIVIYDAKWDWDHTHHIFFGNIAPPNDEATREPPK